MRTEPAAQSENMYTHMYMHVCANDVHVRTYHGQNVGTRQRVQRVDNERLEGAEQHEHDAASQLAALQPQILELVLV